MSTIAFVKKVNSKSGTNRNNRPYTLYSLKLSDKDGNELPGWYQCGFDQPPCKEGDYVKLDAVAKGSNFEVTKGSIKVSKNPPAAPVSAPPSGGTDTSNRGGGRTQQNIHYQNSRTAAIEVVGLLLEHKALPLVKAESKAGAASRFDVITGAVNKLTVQFFNDLESFRLFDTVADAGEVDVAGDGDLPDEEETEDEFSDEFDSAPEEDEDDDADFE